MNIKKIINMQKKLDDSIISSHNLSEKDLSTERILALLVEVGEFANEYSPFKYWKKNKNINKERVLEEFVDGIHFFASLFLKLKIKNYVVNAKIISDNKNQQLFSTFYSIVKLKKDFNSENLLEAFSLYLGNAKLLKITNSEIENHYISKNKINFKRIKNNY